MNELKRIQVLVGLPCVGSNPIARTTLKSTTWGATTAPFFANLECRVADSRMVTINGHFVLEVDT
jgi:hypothetical protein